MNMSLRRITSAALLVLMGLLAACAGDNGSETASSKRLKIKAVDFGFEGVPPRIKAGTALELVNESKVEAHELVAVRLPDGERRSSAELAKLPQDELMMFFSGPPALVLMAPPGGGKQVIAEGDGTLTRPGRYLLLCTVPTGADPEAFLHSTAPGEVHGGPPHFLVGMHGEVIVE